MPKYSFLPKISVIAIVTIGILAVSSTNYSQAHTIEPFVKDYLIENSTTTKDAFLFTNTSDTDQHFLLTTGAYNPENEEFSNGEILAEPDSGRIEVAAGEQVEIPYTIDIPRKLEPGSYFNVIVVEEESPSTNSENSVSLRPGFGIIIAMHVVEEGGSIKGAFTRLTDTAINILNNGFPYLSETEVEYLYRNGSQYVFTPLAEVRIYDMTTNERVFKEDMNLTEEKIYPGGELNMKFSINLWDYKNFTHDFEVISRTYNHFDNSYIEKSVLVQAPPILNTLGYGAVGLIILFIAFKKLKKGKSE